MEKKWIPHTHDEYPLESSHKSLDVTMNHKITPIFHVPPCVPIQHLILLLELIQPHMQMEKLENLGHPMCGSKGPCLLTIINLSKKIV